jgi:ankyrin repeat protein
MSWFKDKFNIPAANPAEPAAPSAEARALFAAVENNDIPKLKALLDAKLPVDTRNDLGETALMQAVHRHQINMVHELLDRQADVNAAASDKLTVLCYAVQIGHWDMVELLAERGAKISGTNAKEFLLLNAALLRATEHKDEEQIKALTAAGVKDAETLRAKVFQLVAKGDWGGLEGCLNNGVPVDLRDAQGNTLLMKAAESGNGKLVDNLIGWSADKDAKNKAGQTALALAKDKEVIAGLVRNGATAPATLDHGQAFYAAVRNGRLDMVDKFINQGYTDLDPPGATESYLKVAVDNKHYEIAARLVTAGASLANLDNAFKFDLAVALIKSRDTEALTRYFAADGIGDNIGRDAGRSFNLMHVAAETTAPIVQLVAKKYPELANRKESSEYSPLRVALMRKDMSVVQAVLDAGAHPDIVCRGNGTLDMKDAVFAASYCQGPIADAVALAQKKFQLMDAAAQGDAEALKEALSLGVNPDVADGQGKTVLYYAAMRGYPDVVQILLRNGADPARKARDGSLPITEAVLSGHHDIVRMLGDAGASIMTPDDNGFAALTYLDRPDISDVMKDAINYCRDLDISKMAQTATRLDHKTSVFKTLRFKSQASASL